jgi:DNA mismatch endonuclease (patch repair protein)
MPFRHYSRVSWRKQSRGIWASSEQNPLKTVDRISKAHRSWNMSRIRGRDTSAELRVRSALHRLGFRFRLHRKDLPGRPDIVLPMIRTVILVHGCFWHRHARCRFTTTPSSNAEFWKTKFEGNVVRDRRNAAALRRAGWRVCVIWECQTEDPNALTELLKAKVGVRSAKS